MIQKAKQKGHRALFWLLKMLNFLTYSSDTSIKTDNFVLCTNHLLDRSRDNRLDSFFYEVFFMRQIKIWVAVINLSANTLHCYFLKVGAI